MSSAEHVDIMQQETGLEPTKVAMPANTAREGVNVTGDSSSSPTSSATMTAGTTLAADKPVLSDKYEVTGNTDEHTLRAPKEDDTGVESLATGLGGMIVTAPLAALEKMSPRLAHGVEAVGTSLVDMAHSLTGTGPQYTSTQPVVDVSSSLPDADQVKSTLASTAQKVQETVQPAVSQAAEQAKPAVANAAQAVHDSVKPAAQSATQQVQQTVPGSFGGQAPPATQQLAQQPASRETGVDLSMEPAGARRQVHPVGAGGNASLSHDTASITSPVTTDTTTGAPAHTYLESAMDAVRGAGTYLSQHVLPGPERQQELSETAAQSLERAPEVASNAAQSTASGLASAAHTTADVAGPAASSAASMSATAAHNVGDAASSAASGAANVVAGVASSVQSAASTAASAVADTAHKAAATAHLPGWNAPAPSSSSEAVHSGPSNTGRGFASPPEPSTPSAGNASLGSGPMGGSTSASTGGEAAVVKDLLRDDKDYSSQHNVDRDGKSTAVTEKRELPALTQEADPSTRDKDEGKGFDLRRAHDGEAALDQQVATHDPDAHSSSNTERVPVFSPELATRAHSDTDVDRPTHPGTTSIPSSDTVGTATILSHETIGGPAAYTSTQRHSSSSASTSFAQPSVDTRLSSSMSHEQQHGYERLAATSTQSSGGNDMRTEGQTASFMPHSSSEAAPLLHQGKTSSSAPQQAAASSYERFAPTSQQSAGGRDDRLVGQTSSFMPHSGSAAGHPESSASTTHGRAPTRDDLHTPSHVDDTHWAGEPTMSGVGSPRTYSATHTDSQPESTTMATRHEGRTSAIPSASQPHPVFTEAEGSHPASEGGSAFSSFQPGQPTATGPTAHGVTAQAGAASSHLSASPHAPRGDSDPFTRDTPSTGSSPSTSHKVDSATIQGDSTSHSPSSTKQNESVSSTSQQQTGADTLKYTDPFADSSSSASPSSSSPSSKTRSQSTSPSSSAQPASASSPTMTAGRGAPLAGADSRASTGSSHGSPAWVNERSSEGKADYPTHDPPSRSSHDSPAPTKSSTSTSGSAQQSHDSHKPTLRERLRETFHHSSH